MKNRVECVLASLKERKYFVLACYALIIAAFSLLFTHFFVKMDDGNFLGIASAPDFTYLGWLAERYNTLSGRTVSEFLMMFFIRGNIILWQAANAALMVYIAWFWCRLSREWAGELSWNKRQVLCCCAMFLMIISCLNPSVFWFAGSFTYLWPFAGVVMTCAPLALKAAGGELSKKMLAVSFFASVLGTAQEQAAASCIALYAALIVIIIVKERKINPLAFLPLLPMVAGAAWLFTAPGIRGRAAAEAAGFSQYLEMNIAQKLCCGLSVFFANSYYLSFFLIILFVISVCSAIKSTGVCGRERRALAAAQIFAAFTCTAVNAAAMLDKSLAHMIFRRAFISGEFKATAILLFAFGAALTLVICALLLRLVKADKRLGIAVGLCAAAGFGCAMAMSFSPSIFQSGQRVFFFTNMFVISALIILLSNAKSTRLNRAIYSAAIFYAAATFAADVFAFRFAELPLMG